jgi:hypothetical protein
MHCTLIGITNVLMTSLVEKNSPFYETLNLRKFLITYITKINLPVNYNKQITFFYQQKAFNNLMLILYCYKIFKLCKKEFYSLFKKFHKIIKIIFSETIQKTELSILQLNITEFLIQFQKNFGIEAMYES